MPLLTRLTWSEARDVAGGKGDRRHGAGVLRTLGIRTFGRPALELLDLVPRDLGFTI